MATLWVKQRLDTSAWKTEKSVVNCRPHLLTKKFLTCTDDEHESCYNRNQAIRENQLRRYHVAAQRIYMCLIILRWVIFIAFFLLT